jgi:hypothetical protein
MRIHVKGIETRDLAAALQEDARAALFADRRGLK